MHVIASLASCRNLNSHLRAALRTWETFVLQTIRSVALHSRAIYSCSFYASADTRLLTINIFLSLHKKKIMIFSFVSRHWLATESARLRSGVSQIAGIPMADKKTFFV